MNTLSAEQRHAICALWKKDTSSAYPDPDTLILYALWGQDTKTVSRILRRTLDIYGMLLLNDEMDEKGTA
jgi:hypothetical protein